VHDYLGRKVARTGAAELLEVVGPEQSETGSGGGIHRRELVRLLSWEKLLRLDSNQ
jgi:hypothetical protein